MITGFRGIIYSFTMRVKVLSCRLDHFLMQDKMFLACYYILVPFAVVNRVQ